MSFLVRFGDGEELWLKWSKDLDRTEAYGLYCSSRPELRQLLVLAVEATKQKSDALKADISLISPGTVVYVDIREWGFLWYDKLENLPDRHTKTYVLKGVYKEFCGSKPHERRKIWIHFAQLPVAKSRHKVDNWFVVTYGHQTSLHPDYIELDTTLVKAYGLKF